MTEHVPEQFGIVFFCAEQNSAGGGRRKISSFLKGARRRAPHRGRKGPQRRYVPSLRRFSWSGSELEAAWPAVL